MHQDMIYVYEIYRLGSIRQAASYLNITQPALSIALRRVEEDIII